MKWPESRNRSGRNTGESLFLLLRVSFLFLGWRPPSGQLHRSSCGLSGNGQGFNSSVDFLLALAFIFVIRYAALMQKKSHAGLVGGLVAGDIGVTRVASAARQVELSAVDFSRFLAELISRKIVDVRALAMRLK